MKTSKGDVTDAIKKFLGGQGYFEVNMVDLSASGTCPRFGGFIACDKFIGLEDHQRWGLLDDFLQNTCEIDPKIIGIIQLYTVHEWREVNGL
jgi:hypothetical protein